MKIKKHIATLMIGAMLSTSTAAFAQSIPAAPVPVAGEVDPGNSISPMRKGQVAPFTGVLLSPQAVATITVNLNSIADKIKIEVTKAQGDDKAVCDAAVNTVKINADADSKRLNAQLAAAQADNKVITARLAAAEKSAPNLSLWVGGGVLGGVVLTLVTTFAVKQATK